MAKITFIGAGSFEFTNKLARDILTFPLLKDMVSEMLQQNRDYLPQFKHFRV